MSDEYTDDTDHQSTTLRLWKTIQELQEVRTNEGLSRKERRRIKTAISELDQARISLQADAHHSEEDQ